MQPRFLFPSRPFLSQRKSSPTAPWANAHRSMGDRPPPHGRSPTAPWAIAHRTVGDENVRSEDGLGGGRLTGACLWGVPGLFVFLQFATWAPCLRKNLVNMRQNGGRKLTDCLVFGVKFTNFGCFLLEKKKIFYLCRVE